jgi:lactate dehydrogenase-like 2-hydroxyacid dehydrogenase
VFGLKIRYFNRTRLPVDVESDSGEASYCNSLEELLAVSDIVSVNCPLNSTTTGMLGHKEFAQMKDGVFFVNTARGAIANESALIDAIESGKVCRAGLDVFPDEPNIK